MRSARLLGADETLSIPPNRCRSPRGGLGESPLATLVRLFLVHAPVTVEAATAALRPLGLQQAVSWARVDGSLARSRRGARAAQ